MATYTNPTGTITATGGDDTIIFNLSPASSSTIDAADGRDSLLVQFDSATPAKFDISDEFDAGFFDAQINVNPFTPAYVLHVENVDVRGTVNDDIFSLKIGPNSSSLAVNMDGGAGQDSLRFIWTTMTTGMSFVVNGATITSSFGTFSNFETFHIMAGSGNDTITTGAGDDSIDSGHGVDHVTAGAGNDNITVQSSGGMVDAGDGNDFVYIYAGSSGFAGSIDGGTGQDHLSLDSSQTAIALNFVTGVPNTTPFGTISNFESYNIRSGSSDDKITTGSADDYIMAGGGNDVVSAGDGTNTVYGGTGNDSLSAGSGNDSISGDAGADTINSGAGVDTINGGAGDDTIDGGDGADTIYGDDGHYPSNTDGTDHLTGALGNDSIFGGGGNDTIAGGADNDWLLGGRGADHIDGGDGNDNIDGYGESIYAADDVAADTLLGAAGDDSIGAGYGDTVDGGTGTDTLSYSGFGGSAGINANFAQLTSGGTITIAGATLTGIEYVNAIGGTGYNDTIVAGASNTTSLYIDGYGGDDNLTGTSGHDVIDGGDGNDVISGGLGFDVLTGGKGTDTFRGTAADLNGDSITGIDVGDGIVITNADPNNFSFGFDQGVLTFGGNRIGIAGDIPGKLVASAAAGGGVQITVVSLPVATIDQIATQLTNDFWSWLGESAHHFDVSQGGSITVDIHTLNADEQTLARAAFGEWRDIIGVNFQEVTTGAQITITDEEDPSASGQPSAYTEVASSGGIMQSAHVHISSSWVAAYDSPYGSQLDTYAFQTYVHEIGHALGLGHSGDYNFDADYQTGALFANDAWPVSVMSYFDQQEARYFSNRGFSFAYAVTPMQADIVAMQSLYGLSTTTRTGNTVYGYNSNAGGVYDASANNNIAFTVFDSGGNDTLDYSGFSGFQRIDLNPETFSRVNGLEGMVSIARGVIVENAIGGSGIDMITGNSANNVITGNAGQDTLAGGVGNDTFRDTTTGLSGDTITDFGVGDKIVISDAALSGFSASLSGHTLTYTGGSLTLTNVPVGHVVVSGAAGGGVQLTIVRHDAANDFNGDGRSDILFRHDDGRLVDWLGTQSGGFAGNGANSSSSVALDWQVAGTGDFNGDDRVDILWRSSATGRISDWLGTTSGGFTGNGANSNNAISTDWQVAGIGDFNGDNRDDILWRGSDGRIADWLGTTSGGFTGNGANSASAIAAEWQVAGVGDFNGDHRDDILWRNSTTGQIADWLGTASGGFTGNGANSASAISTDWHVAGVGDFNGDGRDDILWRNDDGRIADWLGTASGGFTGNGANSASTASADWQVAAIGDYNGDGRDDILWRNSSTGQVTNWLGQPDGGFGGNGANASNHVDAGWHVQPPETFI